MLGRAKWYALWFYAFRVLTLPLRRDGWAKHKDLDSYEARWLFVDALLKILRKYSEKTVARDLVRELESYGGDPANLVHGGTVLDHSFGQDRQEDRSVGHSKLLTQFLLNHYQIKYTMSGTTL